MPEGNPALEFDEKRIDAVFAKFDRCDLPGGVVGIAIGGRPVYRKGFGLANMELPVVLSPSIRIRIASVTKHFACFAYMLLCEDGEAGIDDPVGMYLPEINPVAHAVTMRQLMGHQSGLRDIFEMSHQFSGTDPAVSSIQLLSYYADIGDVESAPGTTWQYNNGAYLLISAVIEKISGMTLQDFFRTRLFEPIGMYASELRRWETNFVPDCAMAHRKTDSGEFVKSNFFGTEWAGEGAIISTVDDMLRWMAHMDAPVVGSAATWKAMTESQILSNGVATRYGLGLFNAPFHGMDAIYHTGGGTGGNALMLKVPSAKLDVTVMVNRSDASAWQWGEEILDACFPGRPPQSKASGVVATGLFRSPTTGRIIALSDANGQQIASVDGTDIAFTAGSDGILTPFGTYAFMKLAIELQGDRARPQSIRYSDFGNADTLQPVTPIAGDNMDAILGHYRCDGIDVDASIFRKGESAFLKTTGRYGSDLSRLECLAEGIWRARSTTHSFYGGVLLFEGRDFRFSRDRARNLKFDGKD